jgi:hypothetical protein
MKLLLNMYQMKINKLNKELDILKEDYAKWSWSLIKVVQSKSRTMFILSSENFLQTYKEHNYLKQYTEL